MKSNLFLHLGIHKTGSTFLQKELFPKLKNICFWDRPNIKILDGEEKTSLYQFMIGSPVVWKDCGELLWDSLTKGNSVNTDILVSDEHSLESNDPYRIGQHLHEIKQMIAPTHNLHVLIVIRRQDTWFSSAYSQISNRFKEASQNHFEKWLQDCIDLKKPSINNAGFRLRYFTLIQKIQDAVGRDSVTVLPYELLKSNPSFFVEQCCMAVNREAPDSLTFKAINMRSISAEKWILRRWSGKRYFHLRPGRVFQDVFGRSKIPIPHISDLKREKEIILTKELSNLILERYRSENKKLDQDLNLGLKEFGYY